MDSTNAWERGLLDSTWVFGPDRKLDSIYQATPQVTMHGWDEGLVKLVANGVVDHCIVMGNRRRSLDETKVGFTEIVVMPYI